MPLNLQQNHLFIIIMNNNLCIEVQYFFHGLYILSIIVAVVVLGIRSKGPVHQAHAGSPSLVSQLKSTLHVGQFKTKEKIKFKFLALL